MDPTCGQLLHFGFQPEGRHFSKKKLEDRAEKKLFVFKFLSNRNSREKFSVRVVYCRLRTYGANGLQRGVRVHVCSMVSDCLRVIHVQIVARTCAYCTFTWQLHVHVLHVELYVYASIVVPCTTCLEAKCNKVACAPTLLRRCGSKTNAHSALLHCAVRHVDCVCTPCTRS